MTFSCLTNSREDRAGTAEIVNLPELRMENHETKKKLNYDTHDRDSPTPMISLHRILNYIRSPGSADFVFHLSASHPLVHKTLFCLKIRQSWQASETKMSVPYRF